MNKEFLKESAIHGTEKYSYAQYHIFDLNYTFYMPYHWHDELEIIYIKSGELNVVIENVEYEGNAGDVFLVNKGQIHMMHAKDLNVEYYTILFSKDLVEFRVKDEKEDKFYKFLDGEIKVPNYFADLILYNQLKSCIERVIKINDEKKELYKMDTKIVVLQILQIVLKNTSENYVDGNYIGKNQEILRKIIAFIDVNYTKKIMLQDIASEVHMSEKYFSRFFKTNFQVNFVDYVNRVRLEKAVSLLLDTDMPVTEVALQCGYSNISYFIRSFKNAFGQSPHVFRVNNLHC